MLGDMAHIQGSLSGGIGEHDDEKPPPQPQSTTPGLPSLDQLANMFKNTNLDKLATRNSHSPPPPLPPPTLSSPTLVHNNHRHLPKVQSNLLKSSTNSNNNNISSSSSRNSNGTVESTQHERAKVATTTTPLSHDQLADWVGERERQLTSAKNEYEKHFDTYKQLTVKFYTERLGNLKLTFKNQILKQKIYFETEVQELCREYWSDFEQQQMNNTTTTTTTSSSGKKTTKTQE